MEGQSVCFTALSLMLRKEKLWGWWIQKEMSWDLTFVKRNLLLCTDCANYSGSKSHIWDKKGMRCKNITKQLIVFCLSGHLIKRYVVYLSNLIPFNTQNSNFSVKNIESSILGYDCFKFLIEISLMNVQYSWG